MRERGVLLVVAVFCLMLSGIHQVDAQDDSADLVFLIDGSNNVGPSDFPFIRDFLVNYVQRHMEVGRSRMQVGVVQYSDDVKIEFTLDAYPTKGQLIEALKNLRIFGGEEANLGAALDYVVENVFTTAAGSRREEGVPQSLIIITAGPSSDDFREATNALKLNSIITFGIGVERADIAELQQIASNESFVFSTSRIQALNTLERVIFPYINGVAQRTIVLQSPTTITEVDNKRDIVFLVDGSSDLGSASFNAIRDFITKVVNRLEIGPTSMQVALAQYGQDVKPEFYLNTYTTKKDIIAQVKKLKFLNSTPLNTGAALKYVQRYFFASSTGSRVLDGIPQLLVLISGGPSKDDVRQVSLELKRGRILTFTLGAKRAVPSELQGIAFDPTLAFHTNEFKPLLLQGVLPLLLTPLKTLTATVVEAPAPVNPRDIVFLLDGSVNVGSANFPLVRDFLINVINNLGVSMEGIRVGLAQFSDTPRTEFNLNSFTSKPELLNRMAQLRLQGGNALNIGSAIQHVLQNHFTSSAGSRIEENIPQLLVILAAGKSTDNIQSAAIQLINSGVLTFCIGVGGADKEELQRIAFNQQLVFEMDDFSSLSQLSQEILTPLTTYFRGPVTEVTVTTVDESAKQDVVFLIDGSDDARSIFPLVQSFLQRVVERLDVGQDRIRIAVVQYSDTARPAFLLNAHSDRQAVLNAIRNLSPIGGPLLNTGSALDYATRSVFSRSSGSRAEEGVPQFLILLTAGKSRDDVRKPAATLKSRGVVPFCIGTRKAERSELRAISLTPDFVIVVPDPSELENVQQTISQRVSKMTKESVSTLIQTTSAGARKDIVFLIDGSDNVTPNFRALQTFLQRVVESLDVGQDKIRIAVVQYSESPRQAFLLNTHQDSQGVLNAIQRLTPIGGTSLNTGNALDYVTRNVFTRTAGSRAAEGVPQFLILLTTGKSQDDVRSPATSLKSSGVIPFAIGTNRADKTELQTISFMPDFVAYVPEISQVETAYETVSDRVGQLSREEITTLTLSVPTAPEGKKDILIMFDTTNIAGRFSLVREFLTGLFEGLNIGLDATRVSVAQMGGDSVKVEFKFDSYPTKQEVLNAVKRMRVRQSRTLDIGSALDYARENLFTAESGSRIREGVPQYLVLLSAGKSSTSMNEPAARLRQAGIATFAIKTSEADADEPGKLIFDFTTSVQSLSDLSAIQSQFVNTLKTVKVETTVVTYDEDRRKDIVFLIDGSDDARSRFLALQSFIQRVVQNLDVGQDKIRIAVAQYSDSTRPSFQLNTHRDQQGVLDAIQRLTPIGGPTLNTGAALDYVTRNLFTKSSGSRADEGVPQFLILLTTGKSRDDVRRPATALKGQGVIPFAIGTNRADTTELETISFVPEFSFSVTDASQLTNVYESFTNRVSQLNKGEVDILVQRGPSVTSVTTTGAKRDVVFLVDGSRSAVPEFNNVKELIGKIVERLDVSPDNTRVSVVQYSGDSKVEFLLNAHSTKDEVLAAVRRVKPKGGNVINTGGALEYVSKNIFTRPAGSRIEEQVPQILIITSSGPSADDVGEGARQVKESAVVPLLIGKNIDEEESNKIVVARNFFTPVTSFRELPALEQNLVNSFTTLTTETITRLYESGKGAAPEGKKDILIMFDTTNIAGRFSLVRDFLTGLFEGLNIGLDATRVSLAQMGGDSVKVEFKFDSYPTKQEVLNAVKRMRERQSRTLDIGSALDYARENLFTAESGSRIREGVPQYLVLLSAGKSSTSMNEPAARLRQAGVATFAIKTSEADADEPGKLIFDFTTSVQSLSDLSAIQSQFVNTLKTVKVETTVVTYDENRRKDIVFLIDGSDDAGSRFLALQSFIQRVVQNLDVGQDKIRIAVAQYSDSTRPSFQLNTHRDQQGVLDAIQRLTPIGGPTLNTGAALDYVTRNLFTKSSGSRADEGVPQFLILLTTGKSRDDVRRPATALKGQGVIPFAIGTNRADTTELETISFVPEFSFSVTDASQLTNVYESFTNRVSQLNKGEVDILVQRGPSVTSVTTTGAKRDVVFLVDGSRSAVPEFNNVKELIGKIVERLDVSPDNTRVSVVQYSGDSKVEFLLNAHSTKDEVLAAVRRIKPKGGNVINTGGALEYVSKNIFTRPAGSRIEEQVPQILIITSSGPSADDVGEGARQVKESAVVPLLIGKNIDEEESNKIVVARNFFTPVTSFRELPALEQNLVNSFTTLTTETITRLYESGKGAADEDRKDVIFLIDGSSKTGQDGIAHIRDFILEVVQNFQIGPNKVRVGLVQFSNEPVSEFFLKTNLQKKALVNNIRRLRLKGGGPLNIGKAVEFVAKNHFVKSAGSRIEEGVPQYLVILTGGKSEDDVSGSARLLQNAKVQSVAVASGTTDRKEIENIVSDPRLIFNIKEFRELPTIERKIYGSFEGQIVVSPTPTITTINGRKEADIVFLVDGSINLGRDNFKEVLGFVSGIVDAVFDEQDAIQIALAQYNSDVTDEFFLKDFTNRDEIMDAVTKAEYKGGRVASLGAAIRHLQNKHFVKEAGSRIGTGVPQIAFIVTGGKSVDDGQTAALALSSKGVKVFAIGVGAIDGDEIAKIASDAPSAFRVPNVQELSELNEQILITLDTALTKQMTLCPSVTGITKDCKLEVILGFDVSNAGPGQDVFLVQRALESKMKGILSRISNMRNISCTGGQKPSVKVSVLSQGSRGAVEAFDFAEYRDELLNKIIAMGNRGPYVLTSKTLQSYMTKFKTAGEDNTIKVVIHMTDGADAGMAELQAASTALRNSGVNALLFVGLENVAKFDQLRHLEFGRGFTYDIPLTLSQETLDFEIVEELDKITEKGCCGVPCKCTGEKGDVGQPGDIGPKGASGLKGHRGYPGDEGGPGERGLPGVNGTQGFQGCPGRRGPKGYRGFSGEKGEIGEIGLDGIDGEDGKSGLPGTSGERGSQGGRGEKGQKGLRGEIGDSGQRGDPGNPGTDTTQRGPKGAKGETGSVGEPGGDGSAGTPGGPGKAGPAGRRGPPGLEGERGKDGTRGGAGEQGVRGPQGPPGPQGTPGTRGEQGLPGPRGPGGTPGTIGDRGRPGQLGFKGEPGDPGVKGAIGPPGPRGPTGEDGRDGSGKQGLKGRRGETGFPGYPGLKGDFGEKGSNGGPGPKGNRGVRGVPGPKGTDGTKGDPGYQGPNGLKGAIGKPREACELVKYVKDKCPCCYGPKECPLYPTDLVFVVDTSSDVNRNVFGNMKTALQNTISQLVITDSNCPRGARVALLTYNSDVTTEIRFSDGLRKPALLQEIKNIQFKQTTKQRNLEAAMSFVARNTFKRSRGGFLIRKVAVFFSGGATKASPQLNEAVLKLYDAGVSSVFLTNREDRALTNALKVNNTVVGQAMVLGAAQVNATVKSLLNCHICLDVCDPQSTCPGSSAGSAFRGRRSATTDLDIDLAFLLDSSESTTPEQFAEIKRFVSHVVGHLELSTDPKSSYHHARISVLQHAPYEHLTNASISPARIDVGLTDYNSKELLQDFILNKMTQLYGTRSLTNAIKYVQQYVLESAPNPRSIRTIFLILTGEVKRHELKQLRETVVEAKCKGFFIVILSLGKKVNVGQLNSLSSEPHDVFSKKADKPSELHEDTLLRFGLQLPGFLSSENAFHLSPEIQRQCDWFQNDHPVITIENERHNERTNTTIKPDEMLSSQHPKIGTILASTKTPTEPATSLQDVEMPTAELKVSDVTVNSATLNWTSPISQESPLYEPTLSALEGQVVTLKQNVSEVDKITAGLDNEVRYQTTVTEHNRHLEQSAHQETFTTASKAQLKPIVSASAKVVVSSETANVPETADPCELEVDMGHQCKEYEVKWFFDKTNKICTKFWYGGCSGNINRFDTEAECISKCQQILVEKALPTPVLEVKKLSGPQVCNLHKEEGTCRDFVLKWYYDTETKSCTRFWYGGCGGNENRFSTQNECEKTCTPVPLNSSMVSAIGT
ncbi:collagen alpha-3(VI) chain isoform X2 [Xenopus laevis]|uniref:Collagen alpha-3(VI) chain isoform X2 n=1 Tax=Xenopus laevis TaxID=8355 RepID=A0A8J1LYT1_XENLA|nr:collagen alpha-3(VI) chain isoform X2 [Xenopus laevis]